MQPNMKKEYRAELKQLRANERKVRRDRAAFEKNYRAEWKLLNRLLQRSARETERALTRIHKRIAIVEGRLS